MSVANQILITHEIIVYSFYKNLGKETKHEIAESNSQFFLWKWDIQKIIQKTQLEFCCMWKSYIHQQQFKSKKSGIVGLIPSHASNFSPKIPRKQQQGNLSHGNSNLQRSQI